MRCPVTCPAEDASAEQRGGAKGLEFNEEVEDGLTFATANGEHPVRRNGLHRFAVVVVHFELLLLVDCIEGLFTDNNALVEHEMPQTLAEICVFADGLGDDMAGTFEGILY